MGWFSHITESIASTVSHVVQTVETAVTHPSKLNIGQVASVILPTTAALPADAVQHPEDRAGVLAITAAAAGGAYLLGTSVAPLTGAGAASTLGMTKNAPAVIQTIEKLTGGDGGGGPVPPPSSPIFGPTGPSGGDFGVWSTGGGGGSGNIYSNPAESGSLSPNSPMLYWIAGGGVFILLLLAMQKKGHG